MTTQSTPSPVSLSYVAALRGLAPRKPGTEFAFAMVKCRKPWLLMCLAASNAEGRFYGIMDDAAASREAQEKARSCRVDNVSFVHGALEDVAARTIGALPPLHYLFADETDAPFSAAERAALFELAQKSLLPGGLFNYIYRAYDDSNGALRFLVREFAPEMNVEQAKVFLRELRTLGADYLSDHPAAAIRLDNAIASNMPDAFFGDYNDGEARSGAFDTLVALRPRGFLYAGDSHIGANYMDLSVSPEAQEIILACATNYLYEPIKDFALNRTVRSDIWCRGPVSQTTDLAELFGSFAYGIVMPPERVPAEIKAPGKTIDLSAPLFQKLISLMTLMPISVGDFLAHREGQGFAPADVIGALQILVACGIARPMRGLYQAGNVANVSQPRFSGALNRYLGHELVSGEEIWLASPVLGSAMSVTAREALVMQALDRAGLAQSAAVLLPELQRLAQRPAEAVRIMDTAAPTSETAQHIIQDTVSRSIVQWYAYGLLEAA